MCRACKYPPKPMRHCANCGAVIDEQNRTGWCKPCVCRRNHLDPVLSAKRRKGLDRVNSDPEINARRKIACKIACNTRAEKERRRAVGKRTYPMTIHSPQGKARAYTPEAIAKRSASRSVNAAAIRERREAERAEAARHGATMLKFRQQEAGDFLKRFAPTYRCDERGRIPDGCALTHWRYGNLVLSPAQLIERAKLKGWESV